MTIFITQKKRNQPGFIYAKYPTGVTVADLPDSAAFTPSDVLIADEANGWKPANVSGAHSLIITFPASTYLTCFAIAGRGLDGVSVEVRGSTDGFASSDVQISAAAALSGDNSAWRSFTPVNFTSVKFIFSGHSSAFTVKHLVCGELRTLPFFADGACVAPLQSDGEHLISHAGLYLGSVTNKVMMPFSLDFGRIPVAQEATFAAWAQACIATAQGFFLVPDVTESVVHFGWVDKKWKYESTMKTGVYTIPKIPFTARAI